MQYENVSVTAKNRTRSSKNTELFHLLVSWVSWQSIYLYGAVHDVDCAVYDIFMQFQGACRNI